MMVSEEWARGQRVSRETYSVYTGGVILFEFRWFKKLL